MYNKNIIEIFQTTQKGGNLQGANASGRAKDQLNGDIVKIFLLVNEDRIIEKSKFKVFGSPVLIAAASIATDMITGRKVEDAFHLKSGELKAFLGEIPSNKEYSLFLVEEAVDAAVDDFLKTEEANKKKKKNKKTPV